MMVVMMMNGETELETYQKEFIATYVKFISDNELFDQLSHRFNMPSTSDLAKYRLLKVIMLWVKYHRYKFIDRSVNSLRHKVTQLLEKAKDLHPLSIHILFLLVCSFYLLSSSPSLFTSSPLLPHSL